MKLHQLFSYFNTSEKKLVNPSESSSESNAKNLSLLENAAEQEVASICFDAREVKPNSVFVAIKGNETDGHNYIDQAIQNGAIALVVENKSKIPHSYPFYVLEAPNTRKILDSLAARFYNFPSEELFCFGVTGTNGKTSITYVLEHILGFYKKNMGVIGTINHRVGCRIWPASMTTPDPVTLQSRLRDFINEGAEAVILEVSSHALEQNRVESVHFNTVIYTNLTLDHLDYHGTMQNYFNSKQKLFTDLMWLTTKNPKFAIINIDDAYGRKIKVAEDVFAWTYGKKESDFQFEILNMNFNETEFVVNTSIENLNIKLPVCGEHTIYNIVASCAAALSIGISFDKSLQALKNFKGVPGRLQKVETVTNKIVFIDYAHTPDALENVLNSINKIRKSMNLSDKTKDNNKNKIRGKLITVFGCGGDRDKSKRPIMGKIASELSEYVIITSDNPRTEDPQTIINDITNGLTLGQNNFHIEMDREQAIKSAIDMSSVDDIVLIAGKGHEDYQIIGTEKIHFSDLEIAEKFLQ